MLRTPDPRALVVVAVVVNCSPLTSTTRLSVRVASGHAVDDSPPVDITGLTVGLGNAVYLCL